MIALRRLTDNDTNFGPLTIGERDKKWRPIYVVLCSGDDEYPGCHIMLRALGWSVRVALPQILKPYRNWVSTGHYEWAKTPNDGYWDVHGREYGFSLSDGFLQFYLGPQTHDSITTKSWSVFLPWKQWRHIRHSLFDDQGKHFWTEWDRPRGFKFRDAWASRTAVKDACPAVSFEIDDYDGQRIRVTTRIEEREWRFGTGWFRWLSLFRSDKVRRSLDIEFDKETGPEKGSWKGGTLGTGIEMQPGELHEEAFKRYCAEEHRSKYQRYRVTFVGRVWDHVQQGA